MCDEMLHFVGYEAAVDFNIYKQDLSHKLQAVGSPTIL
jgi:hypothetical protein